MSRFPKKSETAIPGTALLSKALDVIDVVAGANERMKMRDILEATEHTKPTLYRIMSALVQRGLIQQDPRDHAYSLGPRFTELAGMVARNTELITLSALPLTTLAAKHGERVNLGILEDNAQRTVASWGGFGESVLADVGGRKPLYCTALGKALWAFQPDNIRTSLLDNTEFEAHTPNTHVTKANLNQDIDAVRVRGFATDEEEIIEGFRCVSVPILDAGGWAIAAISVSVPIFRMPQDRLHQIAADLKDAAAAIARRLPDDLSDRAFAFEIPVGADEITTDPGHFFGASAILTYDDARYFVADRMGARLTAVSESGAEQIFKTDAPMMSAVAHDGVILVLSDGDIFRVDPSKQNQEPVLFARPGIVDAEGITVTQEGDIVVSAGCKIFQLEKDGTLAELATDRVADSEFGMLNGKTAYVSTGGISTLDKTEILNQPSSVQSFLQVNDVLYLAGVSDWNLHRVDLNSPDQLAPLSLPVPCPTTLAFDPHSSCLLVGTERIGLHESLIDLAPLSGRILRINISN
jgi:DNA-binding IclR family transcriptional regulator/sugar lactone lactonase YvrE